MRTKRKLEMTKDELQEKLNAIRLLVDSLVTESELHMEDMDDLQDAEDFVVERAKNIEEQIAMLMNEIAVKF